MWCLIIFASGSNRVGLHGMCQFFFFAAIKAYRLCRAPKVAVWGTLPKLFGIRSKSGELLKPEISNSNNYYYNNSNNDNNNRNNIHNSAAIVTTIAVTTASSKRSLPILSTNLGRMTEKTIVTAAFLYQQRKSECDCEWVWVWVWVWDCECSYASNNDKGENPKHLQCETKCTCTHSLLQDTTKKNMINCTTQTTKKSSYVEFVSKLWPFRGICISLVHVLTHPCCYV